MTATSWERLRLTRAPSETCSNCCLCYVTGQVTHLEESAIYPPPHTQAHRYPWLTCIALIDRGRQSMPFTPREYSNSSLPDYRTFLLCHSGSVCLTEFNWIVFLPMVSITWNNFTCGCVRITIQRSPNIPCYRYSGMWQFKLCDMWPVTFCSSKIWNGVFGHEQMAWK